MTKTPWILGAAIAAIAVAGTAVAMPGGPDGRDGPPKTRAEVQAKIAEHFRKADTNGDGYVTKAEADAARDAMKAKFAERRAEHQEERFAELDTNKDGQLSKAEFTAPRDRGDKDRPRARDGRGGPDGKHWGGRGHHGMRGGAMGMRGMGGNWFERADANKDGKVSLAEAQAGPLAMFDKVDTDKDGTISPAEHEAARAAMRAKWQEKRGEATKG